MSDRPNNPTLDNLDNGPSHIMKLTRKEWRVGYREGFSIEASLVDACCDTFKYHWGSLLNFDDGDIYLCTDEGYYGEVSWEPEEKIRYCPFCGRKINVCLTQKSHSN